MLVLVIVHTYVRTRLVAVVLTDSDHAMHVPEQCSFSRRGKNVW
jgi:hypothetical protein